MSLAGVNRARRAIGVGILAAVLLAGCSTSQAPPVVVTWAVGQAEPPFDPQGAPDPVRWSLERLLSRGLVAEDSSGRIVPAAAESIRVSPDGLVYTFVLRRGLTFAGGQVCEAPDFARALQGGINRLDHSTYAWLLGAVTGMDRVRAGRPLPPLGIATPDARTLILRLVRRDSLLLRKLALPGVAVPWHGDNGSARWAEGIGDYRVARHEPARLTLARRVARPELPDTIDVRFVPGVARLRSLLRSGSIDLAWPLPPDLLDQPLPAGYLSGSGASRPARHLLLVLRADLPPTSRSEARQALSYGLHRPDILAGLGAMGEEPDPWPGGAEGFDFPGNDPDQVQAWLERGKLGRSLHVVLAYSAEGPAARVARSMQVEWARLGLDVELRALRPPRVAAEWLRRGGAQLLLVESPPLLADPVAELAMLVEPMRGPPVGGFRTGWRTREFDRWINGIADRPLEMGVVQQRLEEERIVLPLARLPWSWVARSSANVAFHPHFGPEVRRPAAAPAEGER